MTCRSTDWLHGSLHAVKVHNSGGLVKVSQGELCQQTQMAIWLQVSIGSDAVYAAEEYLANGRRRTGQTAIEQISWVRQDPVLTAGYHAWLA